jgi:hypothetical protein
MSMGAQIKDGKLLIDAGFTVSRPRIAPALDSLNADPITRLINTVLTENCVQFS